MFFSRLLHCDHGQILSCIRFSCTEWGPSPLTPPPWPVPPYRRKGMNRQTAWTLILPSLPLSPGRAGTGLDVLPARPAFAPHLLVAGLFPHRLPQGESLDSCCLCPASCVCARTPSVLPCTAPPPTALPVPQPGVGPSAFHSCPFEISPRPGVSMYVFRASGWQQLSPHKITHQIMSPASKFSHCVIYPASPLPNHHHLNKSQEALFSSIR